MVENRLAGRRDLDNYGKVRCLIDDMIRDKREARGAIKLSGGGNQPPQDVDQLKLRAMTSDFAEESSEGGSDTSSVQKLAESLSAIVESLNSPSRERAKEKVRRVNGPRIPPREDSGRAHRRMWRAIASRGRSPRRQGEPLKCQRGKAKVKAKVEERLKAKEKASNAACAEGLDTPRGCAPVKGGFNDLEQDTPEGEDTNEEGCWTKEDDETLQLGYLGGESCLMSSPPGLRAAFSEAGWTVVTHKSRNRQQCSWRLGCSDKRGTTLRSRQNDDNDIHLGSSC